MGHAAVNFRSSKRSRRRALHWSPGHASGRPQKRPGCLLHFFSCIFTVVGPPHPSKPRAVGPPRPLWMRMLRRKKNGVTLFAPTNCPSKSCYGEPCTAPIRKSGAPPLKTGCAPGAPLLGQTRCYPDLKPKIGTSGKRLNSTGPNACQTTKY